MYFMEQALNGLVMMCPVKTITINADQAYPIRTVVIVAPFPLYDREPSSPSMAAIIIAMQPTMVTIIHAANLVLSLIFCE